MFLQQYFLRRKRQVYQTSQIQCQYFAEQLFYCVCNSGYIMENGICVQEKKAAINGNCPSDMKNPMMDAVVYLISQRRERSWKRFILVHHAFRRICLWQLCTGSGHFADHDAFVIAKAVKLGRGNAYSVVANSEINTAQNELKKGECEENSDCSGNKRCINNKCVDYCYNISCIAGYTTEENSNGCCCVSLCSDNCTICSSSGSCTQCKAGIIWAVVRATLKNLYCELFQLW